MNEVKVNLHYKIYFYQQFMSEIRKIIRRVALLLLFIKNILIILTDNYLNFLKFKLKDTFQPSGSKCFVTVNFKEGVGCDQGSPINLRFNWWVFNYNFINPAA